MHPEAHSYDFEYQLERKNVTENSSNLLQLLVILQLIVPVTVISHGEDD